MPSVCRFPFLLLCAWCLVGGEASRPAAAAAAELACAQVGPSLAVLVADDGGGSQQGDTLRPEQLYADSGSVSGGFGAVPGAVLAFPGPNLFVDRWYLLGPLAAEDPRLRGEDGVGRLVGSDARPDLSQTQVAADDRPLRWKFQRSLRQRVEPFRAGTDGTVFAWTQVRAQADGEYWFAVGVDGSGALWVNGEMKWKSVAQQRAYRADGYVAPIELRAGLNDVLLRCRNAGGTMGWSLVFICEDGSTDRAGGERALLGLYPGAAGSVRGVLNGPGRRKVAAQGAEAIVDALAAWHAEGGFHAGLPLEMVGCNQLDRLPCSDLIPIFAGCHSRDLPVNWGLGPALLDPADVDGDHFVVLLTPGPAYPRIRLARVGGEEVERACEIDRHQLLRFLEAHGGPDGAPILVRVAPAVTADRAWEVCDRAAVGDVRRLALAALPETDPVAAWLAERTPAAEVHARILLVRAQRAVAWSESLQTLAADAFADLADKREPDQAALLRRLLAVRHLELGTAEDPAVERPGRLPAVLRRAARQAVNAWFDFRGATMALTTPSAAPEAIDRSTLLHRPGPMFATDPEPLPCDPMARAVALERESRILCRWIFHRLRLAAGAEDAPDPAGLDAVLDASELSPGWNAFFAVGDDLPDWCTATIP